LVLDSVMVAAADQNDGIYNAGILTLTNSNVIGNLYRGLDNVAPGRATLVSSSVYANAGGGIFNSGELTLIATGVDANNLPGSGGPILEGSGAGIANLGAATLLGSAVRNNAVTSPNFGQAVYGGGIYSLGPLTITNSSITGNIAGRAYPVENDGYGAGIYNRGALTIGGSTIAFNTTGNRGGNGGGLSLAAGSVYIVNSTISHNTAGADCTGIGCSPALLGGGIHTAGLLHLNNVTIADNQTSQGGSYGEGGGIYAGGGVTFRNTLIGLNRAGSGPDCFGALTSLDYNLIQNISQCTFSGVTTHNIVGLDPLLGPLQNNGGPTLTRALLAGSPAIDAADDVSCQPVDQRGAPRPAGIACDIGAYERDATPPTATPPPTLTPTPVPATSTPTGPAPTHTPTPATSTPTPATGTPATPTPTGMPPRAYLPLVLYNVSP
jgi:hypothetical protein